MRLRLRATAPADPPVAVGLTPEQELTRALRDYLHEMHSYGPRKDSRWVMSFEWLREIRKVDDQPRSLLWFPPDPAAVETILGIPVEVRGNGGPPHLEAML